MSRHHTAKANHGQSKTYFAYGSNMVVKQMAHRCPGASLVGNGVLHGFVFGINVAGVATVLPAATGTVCGVFWELSAEDEANLDYYEGVASGHYIKHTVAGQLPSGKTLQALIYVASNHRPGRPRPGYLESIIDAAEGHQLPDWYIEYLTRFHTADHERP